MPSEAPNKSPSAGSASLAILLRETAIIICGLTMAVIPLALWVSWSRPVFAGMLVTCMLAMAVVVVLSQLGEDEDDGQTGDSEPGKQRLEGEFLDELHRHVPLVHHRRRLSDPRFRQKMAGLREMIRRHTR